MGYLLFYLLIFILAVPAMVFSILSWRLRTPVMFGLGVGFTGVLLVILAINFEVVLGMITNIDNMLNGVFILALVGIPIFFLISSKMKKINSSGDSDVTDDYLSKIIESDDEEIDYN